MTFADRRISKARTYLQNGFQLLCTTKPNYFYVKNNVILSRQQCQKHKLHKLLNNDFDRNQTEANNMLAAGFMQLFDAGHYKLLWIASTQS